MNPLPAPGKLKNFLSRPGGALTAEYSMYLIALGVVLSNLTGLVFMFFALIVNAMHSGSIGGPATVFALWLGVSSLISAPVASVLWSRTQNETPKGAANGFRTFWLIMSALGVLGLAAAAIYAPLAAVVSGSGVVELLLTVTAPALVSMGIAGVGMYVVTRGAAQRGTVRLLMWGVVALTLVLFATNYIWAANTKAPAPVAPTYDQPVLDPYYNNNYDYPYYQ